MIPSIDSLPGELNFLKLGGSLITDKNQPSTPRLKIIRRLCQEIALARQSHPDLHLVLGHGSGSFGHVPAREHATREGVLTTEQWQGFAQVWYQASSLNRLVVEGLQKAQIPVVVFPPSAGVIASQGKIQTWDIKPLMLALATGMIPVVYGDVAFDRTLGGTILSTEDLFAYLAPKLKPARILLAGLEAGVWEDYPRRTRLVSEITPENLPAIAPSLEGSAGTDVTGGMTSKVRRMMEVAQTVEGLQVLIFTGEVATTLQKALSGSFPGTLIHAPA
jgi:isopentenyl phosphate kinase